MMPSNLFEELMTIQNGMEKAFSRSFPRSWERPKTAWIADAAWIPAADAFLKDDQLTIRVFLPAVKEADVVITLKDNVILISGERHPQPEGARVLLSELPSGKFHRAITLPEDVLTDDQKCRARFVDGVLEITMPVVSQYLRARQIPIETREEKTLATA